MAHWILYRFADWHGGGCWYVSDHPHPKGTKIAHAKGVDWGYETDVRKAKPMSEFWKRRFLADMRRCGTIGYAIKQEV